MVLHIQMYMHMHAMLFVIIVSHCELMIYRVLYVSSFFFAGDIIDVVGILFLIQVPVIADKLRVFVVVLCEYFF